MGQWIIREYTATDVPALKVLWQRVFGDSEEFISAFFASLPELGSGMVAELSGRIAGAGYVISGQELLCEGGKAVALGYIYGLGVEERFRGKGIGKALTQACSRLSGERGAEIVCIQPAEESLFSLYEEWIGVRPVLFREFRRVKAAPVEESIPISSAEYGRRRENMLCGKNHVRLSDEALAFENKLLACYGGGFFVTGSALAAAYVENGVGVIRELITQDPDHILQAAASVAAALGVEEAELALPAQKGRPYLAADRPLPRDCLWNLSYD